jgi:hypothetical protein
VLLIIGGKLHAQSAEAGRFMFCGTGKREVETCGENKGYVKELGISGKAPYR